MNDEQMLKARLKDLATKAYRQSIYTFSPFLGPADLCVLDTLRGELAYVGFDTNGGADICERKMVCFGSEELFGYGCEWPIDIIKIEPLVEKFSDELSHRDFLGALMNLGIDRSVLGDILVKDGRRAYVFSENKMSDFIADNLTKIKHTSVRCTVIGLDKAADIGELKADLYDIDCIVQSVRFDAVLASLLKCSRSEAAGYFKNERVTLNGRLCTSNSASLKSGDVFSVRGFGKYIFEKTGSETRSGRMHIHLKGYR